MPRKSTRGTFDKIIEDPDRKNYVLQGCVGGEKWTALNLLFLLAVSSGRRDVFCFDQERGFYAYRHETGKVYSMDPVEFASMLERPGRGSDQLLQRFPSIAHASSLILCEPGQWEGGRPIGQDDWESQMVLMGKSHPPARNQDQEQEDLVLGKSRFVRVTVAEPSWEEYREMLMATGMTKAEARGLYRIRTSQGEGKRTRIPGVADGKALLPHVFSAFQFSRSIRERCHLPFLLSFLSSSFSFFCGHLSCLGI